MVTEGVEDAEAEITIDGAKMAKTDIWAVDKTAAIKEFTTTLESKYLFLKNAFCALLFDICGIFLPITFLRNPANVEEHWALKSKSTFFEKLAANIYPFFVSISTNLHTLWPSLARIHFYIFIPLFFNQKS